MNMAKATARLITENLRHADGTKIQCVIAEFYARIFFRNSVNGGYLVPLESAERLVGKVQTGDELEVHLNEGYVLNKTRKERHELRPLGDVVPIIEAGGIFEYAKKAGMLKA